MPIQSLNPATGKVIRDYKEMTPEEKRAVLERIAREVERRYEIKPNIQDPPPLEKG